jgi:hypothetical protein
MNLYSYFPHLLSDLGDIHYMRYAFDDYYGFRGCRLRESVLFLGAKCNYIFS